MQGVQFDEEIRKKYGSDYDSNCDAALVATVLATETLSSKEMNRN